VTAEERERFERDGYLVFDPEFPEEVIDGTREDMEAKYLPEGTPRHVDEVGVVYGAGERARIQDGWKINENVKRIALAPNVLSVCEELYGRKPLPFQTLNFRMGTQQPPHADAMHFNSDPPGFMCGVWVALEDMDMDNGPLIYFPGSQKLPLPTWDEMGAPEEGTGEGYPNYSDFDKFQLARHQRYEVQVQDTIGKHGMTPDYGTIRKGQALLWSAQLLHGGSPQRDNNRTRHSQVTHYYFEGSRQYTPMRTEGSREFWRYPWWIRQEGVKDVKVATNEAANDSIPNESTVLVMTRGEEPQELNGRQVRPFQPIEDAGDERSPGEEATAVRDLEKLRAEGASYLLVPFHQLHRLTYQCNDLQQHLENRYRAVVRDGACCAIYDLTSER
jgi:hypothetical protein